MSKPIAIVAAQRDGLNPDAHRMYRRPGAYDRASSDAHDGPNERSRTGASCDAHNRASSNSNAHIRTNDGPNEHPHGRICHHFP